MDYDGYNSSLDYCESVFDKAGWVSTYDYHSLMHPEGCAEESSGAEAEEDVER